VRSRADQGSTFQVRLLMSGSSAKTGNQAPRRIVRGYAGRRVTVLAVDDDGAHLALVRDLLEPLDFRVLTAPDGRQALQLAAAQRPDLALVDLSLPDANGWDLAQELRALPGAPAVRIVIVSANVHEHRLAQDRGAHDDFVRKPIDTDRLIDRIGQILDLHWLYDRQPAAAASAPAPAARAAVGRHHVDDLYQLGRIGHVRGVEAKLHEMEAEDPAVRPLATRLRGLVANFDLRQYLQVIETLRKDP